MINIQTDSRKIKTGDTFVALKCEVNDGHKYIESAIKNGASKVVVERKEKDYGVETIVVEDTRKYITKQLKHSYGNILKDINLIGITGTNGKTTTAFLIYEAFNMLGIKCAYMGTVGFYMDKKIMSLPNTSVDICDNYDLLMTAYEAGYKTIVMEVSSQALSSGRFDGIDFSSALYTNLTEDHLNFHKTMDNYAIAKKELFKKLRNNSFAVINNDDEYKEEFILKENKNITFGFSDDSDYKLLKYEMTNKNTIFTYRHNNNNYEIKMNMIGKYNIYNAMITIIVLLENGISFNDVYNIFPSLSCPPGRLDIISYKGNSIIVDYAHTPDAIEKIIETTKPITKGKLYVIFGCTGEREREKRPIMSKIATENADFVIMTSDDPHDESMDDIISDMTRDIVMNNYEVIYDRKEAIKRGINLLEENDTLLVLGKGHEEFIICANNLRIPFNDHNVVLDILKENSK